MPLGARELLMIVRARDVASRVLREVGTNVGFIGEKGALTGQQLMNAGAALTGVGVALGAAGAVGLAWFNSATDAAIEYNRQAALTKTQVDEVGVSVKDLADIGRRVARDIPAPFDQMQAALYDIFSSMDVNVTQAESLLRGFSKAAVAGQVDIQVAARSSISILNAYRRPVSDLSHVMDVQFQLVRKGVGTYEEFNSSLGRAIPSAVSAGQSIETLAGMMAFLTRNGLSTEMAATSAARALELFSKPDNFKGLEDLGITVRDSSGKFLQMNDIVTQLANNEGWAKMSEPKRKEMFQEIFGTGTIQARRFFDTAIPNFQALNDLTGSMYNSAGALEGAYDIMFDEPATKAQLLKNQYEVLRTEIGDQLIPIKIKLMEQVMKVLDWWNNLDDGTQRLIVRIAVLGSTFLLVAGVILTVIGAFAMVAGALMTLGLSLGGAIAVMTIIPLVIAAIIAAIILLIIHWDTLVSWVKEAWEWFQNLGLVWQILIAGAAALGVILLAVAVPFIGLIVAIAAVVAAGYALYRNWDTVKQVASDLWQTMQDFWDWVTANAVSVWQAVSGAVTDAFGDILAAAQQFWAWLNQAWQWFYGKFGQGFMKLWNTIWKEAGELISEAGETIGAILGFIGDKFSVMWTITEPILRALVGLITEYVWPSFVFVFQAIGMMLEVLWGIFQTAFDIIMAVVEYAVGVVIAIWNNFGSVLLSVIVAAWNFVTGFLSAGFSIISNLFQLVMNVIQGDWGEAWDNIVNIFKGAWDAIWTALQFAWALIKAFFIALPGAIIGFIGDVARLLYNQGKDIMQGLWDGAKAIGLSISDWFGGLDDWAKDFFSGAIDWLYNAGKDILEGLWDGLKAKWESITDWLGGLADKIRDLKGPPEKDRQLLVENGRLVMQGFQEGLQAGWSDVQAYLGSLEPAMIGSDEGGGYKPTLGPDDFFPPGGRPGAAAMATGPQAGIYIAGDLVVREENMVNDLDWWYTTTGAGI